MSAYDVMDGLLRTSLVEETSNMNDLEVEISLVESGDQALLNLWYAVTGRSLIYCEDSDYRAWLAEETTEKPAEKSPALIAREKAFAAQQSAALRKSALGTKKESPKPTGAKFTPGSTTGTKWKESTVKAPSEVNDDDLHRAMHTISTIPTGHSGPLSHAHRDALSTLWTTHGRQIHPDQPSHEGDPLPKKGASGDVKNTREHFLNVLIGSGAAVKRLGKRGTKTGEADVSDETEDRPALHGLIRTAKAYAEKHPTKPDDVHHAVKGAIKKEAEWREGQEVVKQQRRQKRGKGTGSLVGTTGGGEETSLDPAAKDAPEQEERHAYVGRAHAHLGTLPKFHGDHLDLLRHRFDREDALRRLSKHGEMSASAKAELRAAHEEHQTAKAASTKAMDSHNQGTGTKAQVLAAQAHEHDALLKKKRSLEAQDHHDQEAGHQKRRHLKAVKEHGDAVKANGGKDIHDSIHRDYSGLMHHHMVNSGWTGDVEEVMNSPEFKAHKEAKKAARSEKTKTEDYSLYGAVFAEADDEDEEDGKTTEKPAEKRAKMRKAYAGLGKPVIAGREPGESGVSAGANEAIAFMHQKDPSWSTRLQGDLFGIDKKAKGTVPAPVKHLIGTAADTDVRAGVSKGRVPRSSIKGTLAARQAGGYELAARGGRLVGGKSGALGVELATQDLEQQAKRKGAEFLAAMRKKPSKSQGASSKTLSRPERETSPEEMEIINKRREAVKARGEKLAAKTRERVTAGAASRGRKAVFPKAPEVDSETGKEAEPELVKKTGGALQQAKAEARKATAPEREELAALQAKRKKDKATSFEKMSPAERAGKESAKDDDEVTVKSGEESVSLFGAVFAESRRGASLFEAVLA